MSLLLKFIILLIMMFGLLCTLSPRLPGTIIIFLGFICYVVAADINPGLSLIILLLLLIFIAEIGGRALRIYLTKGYRLSRAFSTDTTVANVAGIIALDAFFGSTLGMIFWELLFGKTLLPRLDTAAKILLRLIAATILRFCSGLVMVLLIIHYVII
jgi:uncharacterized protein YqgC (DUF456 family)